MNNLGRVTIRQRANKKKKEEKIWEDTKKMCKISFKNKECF